MTTKEAAKKFKRTQSMVLKMIRWGRLPVIPDTVPMQVPNDAKWPKFKKTGPKPGTNKIRRNWVTGELDPEEVKKRQAHLLAIRRAAIRLLEQKKYIKAPRND